MILRKAAAEDIGRIMEIINEAQEYFRNQQIDQWQDNYPNTASIEEDIKKGQSYVLVKADIVVATAALCFGGEKNYDCIYEGKWMTSSKYATIHRIAVSNSYKGLGLSSYIIKSMENMCLEEGIHSIRIDTHRKNISMQKLLKKNNFMYCGIIYLESGSERIAFEKII